MREILIDSLIVVGVLYVVNKIPPVKAIVNP